MEGPTSSWGLRNGLKPKPSGTWWWWNEDKFFHQYISQTKAWLQESFFLKSYIHYYLTQTIILRPKNFISKTMIQYKKMPLVFWKMSLWVILVQDIWFIMLYFSWDLWFCRRSPNWLLIVLFWDVTLCSLVNRYQPHSITFQKRVHTSSVTVTASWPVIVISKHEEIQSCISPEANF
jgi:hypothetical protein